VVDHRACQIHRRLDPVVQAMMRSIAAGVHAPGQFDGVANLQIAHG
jgi:hypothetical protein